MADPGMSVAPYWELTFDADGDVGTRACTLAAALSGALPASGCVSVDAAEVVRRGGPPSGAHSDIVRPEPARLVPAAGRIG